MLIHSEKATKIWRNLPPKNWNYLAAPKKVLSYFCGLLGINKRYFRKHFLPIVHGTKAFAANHDTSSHAWINEYLRRLFKDMLSDVCITKSSASASKLGANASGTHAEPFDSQRLNGRNSLHDHCGSLWAEQIGKYKKEIWSCFFNISYIYTY